MKQLTAKDQRLLDTVTNFESAARPRHDHHVKRWDRFYKLYRSYRELRSRYGATDNSTDRREIRKEAEHGFGTDLFIPLVFGQVETILPRMLSQNPRPIITPGDPKSEENIDNIALILNKQQTDTHFSLEAQSVAKQGLLYGIGVGKTYWDRDAVMSKQLMPAIAPEMGQAQWVEQKQEFVRYEGPRFESVDIFDWMWNADAHNMRSLECCIERTWPSTAYCRRMFESGAWKTPRGWTEDDVLIGGGRGRKEALWSGRDMASGVPGSNGSTASANDVHEVWEYWDQNQVIVIVNRIAPVAAGDNPFWHRELPFQIFRPTPVPHEMVGIGEPEAIEDLQEEMNTFRSQRRDNATLVLQRPFAYFDGFFDPSDAEFAAAKFWPVDGPPNELIFPLPIQDIPFSSYKEEDALKADVDRASGLSDGVTGGPSTEETATGTQMVIAQASIRIQQKTKMLEEETIAKCCYQWTRLNQQYIVTSQDMMGPPKPEDGLREWSWYPVGPNELAGTFAIQCEGGSMSPQNELEKRQRAMETLMAMQPYMGAVVDVRKILTWVFEQIGFKNPEAYLVPEMPDIPFAAIDLVRDTLAEQAGIDPHEFEALVIEAVQQVEQGAKDPTFGSVGDQTPQSRQQAPPQVGPPPSA